ncbi:DNA polymerase III subunit epsilon [Pararhizobium sp.]|uniref:DNA polymerase III subunit epsilon n=1 Tax=Pararhizobium sp. TaxID=1977563 RepID=UPI00271A7894|nr:DNA polymerase III subunit epsilon [Pararhizobium sp.]MDO9416802.1 DNA polymerase III subunit epsilon [Pararhizobium sp.]
MREIIFDTETTGLDNRSDRVIEIGGVELNNHFPTGRTFHAYINPGDKKVHADALAVHGITDEFLKDKPAFADIAADVIAFFEGARWVAHNATFDMGFMNAEFQRIGLPPIQQDQVLDTLSMARRKHPMGPNSLDALCRRYGIDNGHRTKHGALLDAELLAEVYIEMIGGRQTALGLSSLPVKVEKEQTDDDPVIVIGQRPVPLQPRLSPQDIAAHAEMAGTLGTKSIWAKYQTQQ